MNEWVWWKFHKGEQVVIIFLINQKPVDVWCENISWIKLPTTDFVYFE